MRDCSGLEGAGERGGRGEGAALGGAPAPPHKSTRPRLHTSICSPWQLAGTARCTIEQRRASDRALHATARCTIDQGELGAKHSAASRSVNESRTGREGEREWAGRCAKMGNFGGMRIKLVRYGFVVSGESEAVHYITVQCMCHDAVRYRTVVRYSACVLMQCGTEEWCGTVHVS